MDGGGRLLRSVNSSTTALRGREAAYLPSGHNIARQNAHFVDFPMAPQKHGHRKSGFFRRLERLAAHWQNGLGLLFSLVLIGTAGLYGVIRNGQYEAFIAANGSVQDILAHAVGFGISSITITSQNGVPETTILKAAGINPNSSLPFLDAAGIRDRLMALPMVADAQVRKLYPDRLMIDITERQPYALWQKDGVVTMVSSNGMPIGDLTDLKYADLPFVAGDGANTHVDEFLALLDALGDQKSKFRAGVYIGERRWNLKTNSGIDVKLPQQNPQDALKQLAEIERQSRILEKDIRAIDMRVPGKMEVLLTDEAAAARTDHQPKKKPGSDI